MNTYSRWTQGDKLPFSSLFFIYAVGMARATQVICERDKGNGALYFSLEGYNIFRDNGNMMYSITLPFVLSKSIILVKEGMEIYKYLGMRVRIYFHPSRTDTMTLVYNLGYFEVNFENRVDIGGLTRLWSTVKDPLKLRISILPGSYYRSQFHSKGRFTLGKEVEGCVEDCIRVILDEMDRES